MKTSSLSDFNSPCSALRPSFRTKRSGFTLIEVVLVMVLIVIISSISMPYFAGTTRGMKLRTAARTIERLARYGRSMAIMREETLTLVLNHDTMEVFLGGSVQSSTNAADGELDQAVLERLGYIEEDDDESSTAGIEPEVKKLLPDGIYVSNFDKEWTDEDGLYEDLYLIHFYPNGQCDWFELEFEDIKGHALKMENDPVSGRIWSEFLQ